MSCKMSRTKKILCTLCSILPCSAFAKSGGVNYSWGADALATMHDFVVTMMLYVQYMCYALASVLVVIAALQIYACRRLPLCHRRVFRVPRLFRLSCIETEEAKPYRRSDGAENNKQIKYKRSCFKKQKD